MFKKIFGLICIFILAFTLVGCSNEPTPAPKSTREPMAIHNVGELARTDATSFIIRRSGRVNADVDKAHAVYGIYVEIHNYTAESIAFDVANITCYAGNEACPIYEGFGTQAMNIPIAANGTIEGWLYYKIPAMHDGLSFSYTYNSSGDYIAFVFSEG